jgi:hypothetical protein
MPDRDLGKGRVLNGGDRQLGNASRPPEAYDRPFKLGENDRQMALAGCPPHQWVKETRMGRWGGYWCWVCTKCGAGSLDWGEPANERRECEG